MSNRTVETAAALAELPGRVAAPPVSPPLLPSVAVLDSGWDLLSMGLGLMACLRFGPQRVMGIGFDVHTMVLGGAFHLSRVSNPLARFARQGTRRPSPCSTAGSAYDGRCSADHSRARVGCRRGAVRGRVGNEPVARSRVVGGVWGHSMSAPSGGPCGGSPGWCSGCRPAYGSLYLGLLTLWTVEARNGDRPGLHRRERTFGSERKKSPGTFVRTPVACVRLTCHWFHDLRRAHAGEKFQVAIGAGLPIEESRGHATRPRSRPTGVLAGPREHGPECVRYGVRGRCCFQNERADLRHACRGLGRNDDRQPTRHGLLDDERKPFPGGREHQHICGVVVQFDRSVGNLPIGDALGGAPPPTGWCGPWPTNTHVTSGRRSGRPHHTNPLRLHIPADEQRHWAIRRQGEAGAGLVRSTSVAGRN